MKLDKSVPSKGPINAPITIVEYSDLQCPYCSRARSELNMGLKKYGNKVRWVMKHFPLGFHHWAVDAAIATSCAGREKAEAYWQVSDGFLNNQQSITTKNVRANAIKYARASDLNISKFTKCFDQKLTQGDIDQDLLEARRLGVSGTPAFYINGFPLKGYPGIKAFTEQIEAELNSQ